MPRRVSVVDLFGNRALVRVRYEIDLSTNPRVRELKYEIERLEREMRRLVRDILSRKPLVYAVNAMAGRYSIASVSPDVVTLFVGVGPFGKRKVLELDVDRVMELIDQYREKVEHELERAKEEMAKVSEEIKKLQSGGGSKLVKLFRGMKLRMLEKRFEELKHKVQSLSRLLEELKNVRREDVEKLIEKLRRIIEEYDEKIEAKKEKLRELIDRLIHEASNRIPQTLNIPGHGTLELSSLYDSDTKLIAEYVGTLTLPRHFEDIYEAEHYVATIVPAMPRILVTA